MSDSANEKDRMPRNVLNMFSISYALNIAYLMFSFNLCVLDCKWQPHPGIKMKEKKTPDLVACSPAGGQACRA